MSVINIKCEILFQADFPSIKYKILSFKSVQALKTKPVVLIQTDKSDYRPKQDVKFRSLFHKYQNATISPVNLIDKTYLTGIIINKNCSYIFFYHQVNLHSEACLNTVLHSFQSSSPQLSAETWCTSCHQGCLDWRPLRCKTRSMERCWGRIWRILLIFTCYRKFILKRQYLHKSCLPETYFFCDNTMFPFGNQNWTPCFLIFLQIYTFL
jgi:hypothetical protein